MGIKLTTKYYLREILFVITLGALSGTTSTLFLKGLYLVTDLRNLQGWLLYLLPVFAGIQFYLKKNFSHIDKGFSHLLSNEKNYSSTSIMLTPYIFFTSLATHLFGGSAGREGVGVLMGTSLSNFLRTKNIDNKTIFYCGIASGFSSIFGTPLAAIIFPLELCRYRDIKNIRTLTLIIACSLSSYYMTVLLSLDHNFKFITVPFFKDTLIMILCSGVACALVARLFIYTQSKISKNSTCLLNTVVFASLIVVLIKTFSLYNFSGIGIAYIENSFLMERNIYDAFIKLALTALTLGIGLKGGEVTPLFFMGGSLCNSITSFFSTSLTQASTALGMFTFFGAATLTPITSTIMAYEYYGGQVALITFPTVLIAKYLMGNKSIYK